jgi:hypothetical protein
MSGSAALASARRRRAGPQSSPQPAKRPNETATRALESRQNVNIPERSLPEPMIQDSSNPLDSSNLNEINGKVHPLTMLLQHNTILSNIQSDITTIKKRLDIYDTVKKKVDDMSEQLDSELNVNNISFYKKRYEVIKKQLEEIKKLIVKIQTFSMETNLSVIELKKSASMSTKDLEKNEEKSQRMSDVLTTSVQG